MQKIIYADMHCDTATVCCNANENPTGFCGQTNIPKLLEAGCAAQCFAIFTEGKNAAVDFERFTAFYNAKIAVDPRILPVERYSDIEKAQKEGKLAAVLTVENLGFLDGDYTKISELKAMGVQMASLVWNTPNKFAFPNLIFKDGMPDFAASEKRGLTEHGLRALEELNRNRIIVDVSHLSDGGTEDILSHSSAPIVASHSNCRSVCPVSRNLTDAQIKKIADKGGAVGLNFCRDFIGGESAFEGLFAHYNHLVKIGGEDLPAIGSDFDGIPPYEELADCLKVQPLLQYFSSCGVTAIMLEKLAFGNFARVFKEVVG